MDNKNSSFKLSKSWVWTKFEDIGEINPKFKKEEFTQEIEVTFLPMRCVEEVTGKMDLSLTKALSKVQKGYTPFRNGDLLFAKITPCMENGKVAIAINLHNGLGFGSTEFHVIRLCELLPQKFFFYYLIQEGFRKEAKRNMKGTAGQLRVPADYIRQAVVSLPPLPEQHRIVAKIEELLTKLDAGIEALRKIKAQLKRYRQAVLKYAFKGKLTEQWRKKHKDELEPASVLLERIKEERKKIEQKTKKKQKRLPPFDVSDLPELPERWVWIKLGEIITLFSGFAFKSKNYINKGISVLRMGNIQRNFTLSFRKKKQPFLSEKKIVEFKEYLLNEEDIVMSLTDLSGSGRFLGTVARLGKRQKAFLNQRVSKLIISPYLSPDFIFYSLQNPQFRGYMIGDTTGSLQRNTSHNYIYNYIFPLPPLSEQQKIVEEIEHRFSIADEIEKTIDLSLKQAVRLRQSILKRAFEGKLVPQDPDDEPVEKLLERIKVEKAKFDKEKSSKKKWKRKTKQRRLL